MSSFLWRSILWIALAYSRGVGSGWGEKGTHSDNFCSPQLMPSFILYLFTYTIHEITGGLVNAYFGIHQMGHLVLGCLAPVAYRKEKKRHKKGWSDWHLPWPFETPSLPLHEIYSYSPQNYFTPFTFQTQWPFPDDSANLEMIVC